MTFSEIVKFSRFTDEFVEHGQPKFFQGFEKIHRYIILLMQ